MGLLLLFTQVLASKAYGVGWSWLQLTRVGWSSLSGLREQLLRYLSYHEIQSTLLRKGWKQTDGRMHPFERSHYSRKQGSIPKQALPPQNLNHAEKRRTKSRSGQSPKPAQLRISQEWTCHLPDPDLHHRSFCTKGHTDHKTP